MTDREACIARAVQALGSAEKVQRWLQKPSRALGGERPIDLLASEDGTRRVEQALGQLEHGVMP